MSLIDGLLQELDEEAATTRRVLERVPEDRLAWRPHEKARTLGQLAFHVATVPGTVADVAALPSPAQFPQLPQELGPGSAPEFVTALGRSVANARAVLGGMSDAELLATWRLLRGDQEIVVAPRLSFLRTVMLNHWYHHRGQLTTYLRALDVRIPSIYGPSADENPFV